MKPLTIPALLVVALIVGGCSPRPETFEIPAGTDVSVEKRDGVKVAGRLVEVQAQTVVLESRDGQRTRVPRSEIAALRAVNPAPPAETPAPKKPAAPPAPAAPAAPAVSLPEYRQVTIPAGTVLPVELRTAVGSATSKVEDPVRGTLRRAVAIEGLEAIPAGTTVLGTVTEASRSARVKGRARVAFRFSSLDMPGDAERVVIRTGSVAREAEGTKKQDAAKIGGGAGTGVVLSTRGKEVTLPAGTAVSVKLLEPATVRVRVR